MFCLSGLAELNAKDKILQRVVTAPIKQREYLCYINRPLMCRYFQRLLL